MKLTNQTLIDFLNKIAALKDKKCPMAVSRALILTHKSAKENYEIYEEQLKKLFDDCALRDDNGEKVLEPNGFPRIKEDCIDTFNTSLNDLLNLEIDIEDHKFSESLLDNWDDTKYDVLTPDEVEILLMLTD